jgi:hypothetical protein
MEQTMPNSRSNSSKNYLYNSKTPKIIKSAITVSALIVVLFIGTSLVNLITF